MDSRNIVDVVDHQSLRVLFAASDRTFPGMYAKICQEFILGPPPVMLVVEPADPSYQHSDDHMGPITLAVSVKEPSFVGLLGVANCMWGRRAEDYMYQLRSRYGVQCVWENPTCQCFVATSTNEIVQQNLAEFPKVGGVCILGKRVVYQSRFHQEQYQ